MKLLLVLVCFILLAATVFANPPPISRTTEHVTGTISGSPVIAVVHGEADPPKTDLEVGKDTEKDPLTKYEGGRPKGN